MKLRHVAPPRDFDPGCRQNVMPDLSEPMAKNGPRVDDAAPASRLKLSALLEGTAVPCERTPRPECDEGQINCPPLDQRSPLATRSSHAPRIVAHRGGSASSGENSLEAIAAAVERGFFVETDVARSPEGHSVLVHPRGITRVLPHQQTIAGRRLQIDHYRERPKLEDLLGELPQAHMMIDVKEWPAVDSTVRAIVRTRSATRVTIGCFSTRRTLATIRGVAQETGITPPHALGPYDLALALSTHFAPSPGGPMTCLAQVPHQFLTRRNTSMLKRKGFLIYPWIVNTRRTMLKMIAMGVDGIITDYPEMLWGIISSYQEKECR